MRDNFRFWKMAWERKCVSAENLKKFIGIELTAEQYTQLTGIVIEDDKVVETK